MLFKGLLKCQRILKWIPVKMLCSSVGYQTRRAFVHGRKIIRYVIEISWYSNKREPDYGRRITPYSRTAKIGVASRHVYLWHILTNFFPFFSIHSRNTCVARIQATIVSFCSEKSANYINKVQNGKAQLKTCSFLLRLLSCKLVYMTKSFIRIHIGKCPWKHIRYFHI